MLSARYEEGGNSMRWQPCIGTQIERQRGIAQSYTMLSMRIVCTDHFMAEPVPGLDMVYSEFRRSTIYRVPVIRIFGPTTSGQKTCLHVHGVFPYLYALYDGTLPAGQYLQQFAANLDKAINISQGKASSTLQHVYKVSLVSGIVADLLLAGAIMNRVIQPYESHIPYMLQMFMDYNLFGMNLVNASAVKFRQPVPPPDMTGKLAEVDEGGELSESSSVTLEKSVSVKVSGKMCHDVLWTSSSIPQELLLSPDIKKMSACELEVDVVAADILNRVDVTEGILGANPGLVALWEDEKQRRSSRNLSSALAPPDSPDREYCPWMPKELQMQQQLHEILQSFEPYASSDEKSVHLSESTNDLPAERTLTQASDHSFVLSQQSGELSAVQPMVDDHSVLQTSSQDFPKKKPSSQTIFSSKQMLNTSLDRSLLNILASLADLSQHENFQCNGVPPSDDLQQVLSQVTALEERDSLLSQVTSNIEDDVGLEEDEALESLEMSQALETVLDEQILSDYDDGLHRDCKLEGMDDNGAEYSPSLAATVHTSSSSSDDDEDDEDADDTVVMPQLDGPPGLKRKLQPKSTESDRIDLAKACNSGICSSMEIEAGSGGSTTLSNDATGYCNSTTAHDVGVKKLQKFSFSHCHQPISECAVDLYKLPGNSVPLYRREDLELTRMSCTITKPDEGTGVNACSVVPFPKQRKSCRSQPLTSTSKKPNTRWRRSIALENDVRGTDQEQKQIQESKLLSSSFVKPMLKERHYLTRKRKHVALEDLETLKRERRCTRGSSTEAKDVCEIDFNSFSLISDEDERDVTVVKCDEISRYQSPLDSCGTQRNVMKQLESVSDFNAMKHSLNIIREVSVTVEKLQLTSPSVRLERNIVNGFERFSFHPISLHNDAGVSQEDVVKDQNTTVNVEYVSTETSTGKSTGVSSQSRLSKVSSLECNRYGDSVDGDCTTEHLDVLSKFALLSSPESSDLESTGPVPISPTQDEDLSLAFSDETVVVEEEKLRQSVDDDPNSPSAEVNPSKSNPSTAAAVKGSCSTGEQMAQNSAAARFPLQGDSLSDKSASETDSRSVDLFSEVSFKGSVNSECSDVAANACCLVVNSTANSNEGDRKSKETDRISMTKKMAVDEGFPFGLKVRNAKVLSKPKEENDCLVVIRPLVDPPLRSQVVSDMLLDSFPLKKKPGDAFYSNPKDLPPRLRDGEADVTVKVQSPLVSDLPEHMSFASGQGLRYWQNETMAKELSAFGHSQSSTEDILQRITAQPSLSRLFVKDRSIVITPCRPPPSRSVVQQWLDEKQKQIKAQKEEHLQPKWENEEHLVQRSLVKARAPKTKIVVTCDPVVEKAIVTKGVTDSLIYEQKLMKQSLGLNLLEGNAIQNVSNTESTFQEKTTPHAARDSLLSNGKHSFVSLSGHTACIRKASCIELEIPNLAKVVDYELKEGIGGGAESSANEETGYDEETAVKQTKWCKDLPVSGEQLENLDDLPETIASTPVHQSEAVSRRMLKCFEDEGLLLCTPIQKTEELTEEPVAAAEASLQKSSTGICDAANKREDGDGRQTPLSSRLTRLGRSSTTRRLLISQEPKLGQRSSSLVKEVSQIEGPTLRNTFGFKVDSQNVNQAKGVHEYQYLTVLSVELHVATRGDLRPDPEFDEIRAIFYCLLEDRPPLQDGLSLSYNPTLIMVDTPSADRGRCQSLLDRSGLPDVNVTYVASEDDLLTTFVDVVQRSGADILVGYEIQKSSWGYLLQRAAQLSRDLCSQLSRIPVGSSENHFAPEKDEYGANHMSEIHIAGRIVLNLWRLIRHEVTLNVYTFENAAYHVLHQRVPNYSHRSLTEWFDDRSHLHRWRTIEYFSIRARGNLQLIEKLDIIGQTSEFARIYGIEFYDVLNRGSQFRVESMMLRMAKPLNFIAVSPSVQQRARMRAPECIPLTLEPKSEFYTHPVIVLDFQSLYPSIMIAYNYCYSTCLGRLEHFHKICDGPIEFGCTSLNIPPKLLKSLEDNVTICPNGVVFVKQNVRKGIMSRMVEDILNTRLMVKKSMKDYKENKTLQRLLHARQLGLKLIANVTFGYTSANYSGRMPCVEYITGHLFQYDTSVNDDDDDDDDEVGSMDCAPPGDETNEIGDSILRKSRETLERAIKLVETTPKWAANVIYGDTDSMFILLHGRTKDEAFVIGQEIADAVTAANPKPVKLRFEKVYLPCILQTKKRYVGFMYETADQKEPVFDAKGIETVRRDSCSAVSKMLEKSIKILFTTYDVSPVKQYVQRQFVKMIEGRACLQDFIFAKEFRGSKAYQPGSCVPALEIARRVITKDRRAEPLVGERVPYVIVFGMPGLPLIQLVRQPHEVVNDPSLRLNTVYYITKQIVPPLLRIFSLLDVNVLSWYQELPRVLKTVPVFENAQDAKKGTISQYFMSLNCPICEDVTNSGICADCKHDQQRTSFLLGTRIQAAERTHSQLSQFCVSCMGCVDLHLPCMSLDCPVFFRLVRSSRDLSVLPQLLKFQGQLLQF